MRLAGVLVVSALVVVPWARPVDAQTSQPSGSATAPVSQQRPHGPEDHAPDEPAIATGRVLEPHAGHQTTEPLTPIPPITDADRAAAFSEVEPHGMRDNAVYWFALLDRLEWQGGDPANGVKWDAEGWIGRDRERVWFRSEGHTDDGRLENAEVHLFYGRSISRWWDLLVGVRQDLRPGPAQTWAAFGVKGLAPYWFEVEATGYASDRGQMALRLEADYELLLTNRMVARPLIELDFYGKSNPERKVGAGLADMDVGLNLRYEIRRELAPYVGVTWHDSFGETRRLTRALGEKVSGLRFVSGVRFWY